MPRKHFICKSCGKTFERYKRAGRNIKNCSKMGAIDPGPTESAFLVWDGKTIIKKDILENNVLLSLALAYRSAFPEFPLVIEKVVSYGMTVGASTFETVYWTGRFCQAWPGPHFRVPRLVVKQHLCHDSRAKDTNIRQALVDRFACGQKNNGKGTKKAPGFFYGVKTHLWQALALAVTFYDQNIEKNDVI